LTSAKECGNCGFLNDDRAHFCGKCGANLQDSCPKCGAAVRARQNFCSACGEALAPVWAGWSKLQTPEHLADRISPAEAERKIATVLFADIANSTELIRDLDAEEAKRLLVPTVERLADAVHRYEGIVVRDRGDGIMASFGAPVALEDHAVRACYAALDMQKAMRIRGNEIARDLGLPLLVRVGINSGPVVVTVKYEGGKAREIRVDGVPTHIAARLEPLATPGTILLSRETLALAEGFVRVRALGPRTLKGIQDPVQVCQLEGVNTRMRIHALAARGLSKFVGRQHEIEMLQRMAGQALAGHGQVVALVGEAGVGKSRVFLEFIHSSTIEGWLVLEAGSVSYGKATSYLPLVDLLTRYFDIQARDDEQRVRDKVVAKLSGFGEEKLLAQTPFFLGALGMALKTDIWTNLAPAERQRAMFDALKRLLIRESQKQPLCLVFEDLHWIDAETHAFLEMLSESIPAARLMLLVNYRPEHQSIWAGRSYFSQVRIDPLAAASADTMLDELLGSHAELGPIKRALIDVTEGNPLFLEESVRSLIESGVLSGKAGDWHPRGSLPAGFVPPTIEALLAARIDRLQPELKEILQCAAVIGSDIPLPLLQAVGGMPQHDIERGLRELQAAEFLYEKTLFPETEYTFKHAMTREVAYASLLRERRKVLHARAAHALVALAAGRVEEQVERIAQHAEQGGLWEMALDYLERAGAKAFALYANTDAAGFFERALGVLRHLPESRATLEQAVDLRFKLRNALIALCELDRIRQCLDEIEPILAGLGDKVRSARHAAFRCNHHFLAGEQRLAIEFGKTGLRLARELGDRRVQGELLYRLGQSYHLLGDNRPAIALIEESLEYTVEQRERNRFELSVIPAVVNRTWLVSVLAECGDFKAGMTHAKRALEIAEDAEHPLSEVLGWLAIGHVLRRKGELDGAIGALERGMALCDRYSLPMWHLRLLSSLGIAYARCGRMNEGMRLAAQALEGAERLRLIVDQPMMLVRLGQASLVAARIEEAMNYGKRALELALAHDAKGDEAWARFLIARAYWASAPRAMDESAMQLDAALRLAIACEARPLAAFCQATLGAIHARRGDKARAQEFTAAADAICAELDMRPLPLEPVR
jgi:class 3 adenylate cyclase/tetratricopeptide (TPR) repeat protein